MPIPKSIREVRDAIAVISARFNEVGAIIGQGNGMQERLNAGQIPADQFAATDDPLPQSLDMATEVLVDTIDKMRQLSASLKARKRLEVKAGDLALVPELKDA